jgi:Rrf2 family protein
MTSRFTMALHALGMIAWEGERSPGQPVTSETLARSINTNPVVVRRVLADLRRAGLVETRRGVGGGVVLAKPASRISLRLVWEALEGREQLFGRHPSGPNPRCPVGCCVADYLEELYGHAAGQRAGQVGAGGVAAEELLPLRHRLPDRPEGDAAGRTGQRHAAAHAAPGLDEPGPLQDREYPPHHHRVGVDAAGQGLRGERMARDPVALQRDVAGRLAATRAAAAR